MREKLYRKLSGLIIRHNGKVILFIICVTVLQLFLSMRLGIKNQLADMMPSDVPQVESFNRIIEDFTSDAQIMITIKSAAKDKKRMIEAAEIIAEEFAFIPRVISENDTVNFVKRVDSRLDVDFFRQHGAIIQKNKDLKNFIKMYADLNFAGILANINDNFESEFVGDSDNLSSIDGEAQAVIGLNNIYAFISSFDAFLTDRDTVKAEESATKLVIGDEYMFSPDREMLLMSIVPTVSTDDFDNLLIMCEIIIEEMAGIKDRFPDLEFALAGTPIIGYEEQEAIVNDFGWSTVAALFIVMLIVISSFKSWKSPFYSILTLTVSIIWVAGLLAVTLHYLNTMSAAFGVMLVGLGIDFAIHFLSGYRDALDHGKDPEEAIDTMYQTVGNGVLTGGLTTAMVFFILIFLGFRAFGEMGFAMGSGIMMTLAAMFVLLPALIVRDNRKKPLIKPLNETVNKIASLKPFRAVSEFMQFHFMENIGKLSKHTSYIIIVITASLILTVLSVYGAYKLEYEYDMTKLEPEGMPAIIAQDEIIDKFEISPDFAMFTVTGLDSARSKVAKIKKLADRTGLIGRVECVSEFFQPEQEQRKNQKFLAEYRNRIKNIEVRPEVDAEEMEEIADELERLHYNFVEIGELSVMSRGESNKIVTKTDEIAGKKDRDSKILKFRDRLMNTEDAAEKLSAFQKAYAPGLRELLYNISDTTIVSFETFPSNIKERYYNENTGRFLISIYPKNNIWEERNLNRFHEQTSRIDEHITGLPVLMLIFIDIMKDKGSMSILFGTIVIIILLTLDFRSFKYTLMALVPLAIGSVWMLGLMYLFGMKLNINNYMALPIIIGIGIDDGVHMLHRYMIEGRNSIDKVTKFTGKAILLTSLTTMISFGSIGIATHRGLASMGIVLVLGVGSCFISSAFLLPAMISLKDRIGINGGKK
ncbi:MAG TPA: MMPL family transporter [Clostridiales bacterium]|nr:MMPL family transporter [Clostridiales bacterium]